MSYTSKMKRDRKVKQKKKNARHLFKFGRKKTPWRGHRDENGRKIYFKPRSGGYVISYSPD